MDKEELRKKREELRKISDLIRKYADKYNCRLELEEIETTTCGDEFRKFSYKLVAIEKEMINVKMKLKKETMEEKYINRMKEYEFKKIVENFYDNKDLHMHFDNCILNFLEELGYKDIVKYYRNSRKRYEFWYD